MRMYGFRHALKAMKTLCLCFMLQGAVAQPLVPQNVAPGVWMVQGVAALGSVANRNFISNAAFVVTADAWWWSMRWAHRRWPRP